MSLRERITRLEVLFEAGLQGQAYIPKRPIPEWLQESMEDEGYVFHVDEAGRLKISSPTEKVNESVKTPG